QVVRAVAEAVRGRPKSVAGLHVHRVRQAAERVARVGLLGPQQLGELSRALGQLLPQEPAPPGPGAPAPSPPPPDPHPQQHPASADNTASSSSDSSSSEGGGGPPSTPAALSLSLHPPAAPATAYLTTPLLLLPPPQLQQALYGSWCGRTRDAIRYHRG
ncbi:hypothetical protein Agub_g15542, partial [Astrephomene gubernaculifera]